MYEYFLFCCCRQIEGKVVEISQLQEIFSEKVLHQVGLLINHIYLRSTVEPQCSEPLYNGDPCITKHIHQPSNSKMYGKGPRYNEPPFNCLNTFCQSLGALLYIFFVICLFLFCNNMIH